MKSLDKAVWYFETYFGGEISLPDVANAAGLSKFHLVRAFSTCTGKSVMRYVRERRLSEAAKRLADGGCGILDVALDAGYNSHEAFTRAFKAQFEITPAHFRKARSLDQIQLVEPLKMDENPTKLPEPRMVDSDAMIIVGLKKRYSDETSSQIPAQWQTFQPHIGNIDNQKGNVALGVMCNSDDEGNIDYITGVEVSQYTEAAKELDGLRLSPQTYAVFQHDGHVSEIRRTWRTIFSDWVPDSGCAMIDAPQLERYGEGFDPQTGMGDIEIWIPVTR